MGTWKPVKVGVIWLWQYQRCIFLDRSKNSFEALEVVACADLAMDRAEAKSVQWGIHRSCTVEELLADPENRDCTEPDCPQRPIMRLAWPH